MPQWPYSGKMAQCAVTSHSCSGIFAGRFSLHPPHLQRILRFQGRIWDLGAEKREDFCSCREQIPCRSDQGKKSDEQGIYQSALGDVASVHPSHDSSQSGCCDFSLCVSKPKLNPRCANTESDLRGEALRLCWEARLSMCLKGGLKLRKYREAQVYS